jgi:hypothetical protein
MRLEAVVDGKRVKAEVVESAKPVRQGKSEAEYRSKLKIGPVDAALDVRYDCDGSMHARVTYTGKKSKIDSLELVTDIDGLVDLCLSETGNGGMTGADRWECSLPAGPGILWDSRSTAMEMFYNKFVPWFWFGSADRGWSWYCDSDAGWLLDRGHEHAARTRRQGGGDLAGALREPSDGGGRREVDRLHPAHASRQAEAGEVSARRLAPLHRPGLVDGLCQGAA